MDKRVKDFIKTVCGILPLLCALLISIQASGQGNKRYGAQHKQQPHRHGMVSGRVTSAEKEAVEFATVYLKDTRYGQTTSQEGIYHLKAPAGRYTLVVSAMGYETVEQQVEIAPEQRVTVNITLKPQVARLEEVIVVGNGVSVINKSAYNAVAIDAKALHNSTQDLASALIKVPGVKVRESGGVGSELSFSLDGFSGKHVRVFLDGVPQEGVGQSFSLNNIPINFADRIEVYKGVVPVGFGTDALGGVVNIVTNRNRRSFADVSYSFGSFNTHRSHINAAHTLDNGLMLEVSAFQSFSDNSYKITTPVKDFATGMWDTDKPEKVKRFHDRYHNEAVIGKVGFADRSFADRMLFSLTYSQSYKEIQNGVIQTVVYGQKKRKGHSLMPGFEYSKHNLFTDGLDVNLTANYNKNYTRNIDTSRFEYNWRGEKRYMQGKVGEQNYQDSKFGSDNTNATFTASYRIDERNSFMFNYVLSAFDRSIKGTPDPNASGAAAASLIKKKTRKNVAGLSYRYSFLNRWNASVFGKYYNQFSSGPYNTSESGYNYAKGSTNVSAVGYGTAATCYILPELQIKFSYEKALRLPTTDELFGDDDLELGAANLKPEKSHNLNLSLSLEKNIGNHSLYVEGGGIYRNTSDYIRRVIGTYSGGLSYASHENHGKVKTWGINAQVRYNYSDWLSVGGNLTLLDIRNYERYVSSTTKQESTTYKVRIPNIPYLFSNTDVSFYIRDFLKAGNNLTITYDNYYVHRFSLYWENHGSSNQKGVPSQFSHNVSIVYSLKKSRYNFSIECRNLTDEKLYDNYSLQKAGRAVYGKIRFYFGK